MDIVVTLLAALPLVLILVLMAGLRWNGAQAGAAGWASALVIAALAFGAGPRFLLWSQIQGAFRALYVLYIIWGALFFFRVTEANGTLKAMSQTLQQVTPQKTQQVLLLAWAFTSFLQGVGGFGVPVAVAAPILVGMGFTPIQAVVMPSLGHAWAISFGSLGASFEALHAATGLPGPVIAPPMALALGVVCFLVGFIVLGVSGGKRALRRGLGLMLAMATVMSVTQYVAVRLGVYNIAAMLGAVAGLAVGVAWALLDRQDREAPLPSGREVLTQTLPYLVLIGIILAANFIGPLDALLNRIVIQIRIPSIALADGQRLPASATKAISIFGHAGALLIYAGLFALLRGKARGTLPPDGGRQIRQGVLRSGLKSTVGILTMVCMAATMQNAGMIARLSDAMAQLAGEFFPLVAPAIGALGAFMTGSNTNSNVIFGAFQQSVAGKLGYTVATILAAHNAGAAVGSVSAPAKIIVGCSTVGLSGGEGEALRRTARYSLAILVILALLAMAAVGVTG
jgi:lactate permease